MLLSLVTVKDQKNQAIKMAKHIFLKLKLLNLKTLKNGESTVQK